MMGLFIGAWAGLPIEAVVVWIAVTYGTTIVYEAVKIWQSSGKPARRAFFGGAESGVHRDASPPPASRQEDLESEPDRRYA
jgi:hypothetical protein